MKTNNSRRAQHRPEATIEAEPRPQMHWSWRRSAISFALGATATATVLLLLDSNRMQNQQGAGKSTVAAAQAAPSVETSKPEKELSREELDRYVQWVQQMNTQTRNLAGGNDLLAAMGGLQIGGPGGPAGAPAPIHDPLFPLRSGVPGRAPTGR